MDYVVTVCRRPGVQPRPREPLFAIWIDGPEIEPRPGRVWQMVQRIEITKEEPIPAALCGLLLMSESTSDRLFRHIADTWRGLVEDDPLDDYDRYASRVETAGSLDEAYLDRLEDS